MNERRVVITGIGTVSPLGNDLKSTWEGLKAGKSGIDYITQLDTTDYPVKIGGEASTQSLSLATLRTHAAPTATLS